MRVEIETASIGTPDYLHPAVSSFTFRIPTVLGIVSHLLVHVLSKPEVGGGDPYSREELLDSRQEVPDRVGRYI